MPTPLRHMASPWTPEPLRLLLFDIDGTLTRGGPARAAFALALERTFGTAGPIAGHDFWRTPKSIAFPGVPALPYTVPGAGDPLARLHLCEGEVDAESLRAADAHGTIIGLPGASARTPAFRAMLAARAPWRRACLWYDGDEAGQKAAKSMQGALVALGVAVTMVRLPCGMDVNDYLVRDPGLLEGLVSQAGGPQAPAGVGGMEARATRYSRGSRFECLICPTANPTMNTRAARPSIASTPTAHAIPG